MIGRLHQPKTAVWKDAVVLRTAVHPGDFNVVHLGELDTDRAYPAAGAVDQQFETRPQRVAGEKTLHRELPGLGHRLMF